MKLRQQTVISEVGTREGPGCVLGQGAPLRYEFNLVPVFWNTTYFQKAAVQGLGGCSLPASLP